MKYKVYPDIATYGKALGNGYAITPVLGNKYVMENSKDSFISSTFWTERIGPTAALKTLDVMKKIKSWKFITEQGAKVKKRWAREAKKNNLNIETWGLDSLAGFTIKSKNSQKYKTFITQEMLKKKILATNSVYLSIKHTDEILSKYFENLKKIFKIIGECEEGRNIDNLLENPISENTFRRLN